MLEYLPELMKGLHTSLTLTAASIAVALVLSLLFTIVLTLKTPGLVHIVRAYITLFTGTPLLVQIFLIYYGPGQFPSLQHYPVLWHPAFRAVAVRIDCAVAQQRRVYHAAVLRRDQSHSGRSVAVLQRLRDEQERHAGHPVALCL
ncbi:Arginine ABC transporter permease protein ArtM [Cedecea neteri]|uniref:Arginine ABC transporter permease protein ArtM n=1 Tax=Cedecea neteri TaxID=158822 RepID=A0A2X2TAQ6_9ENTR|nr:Arginine ABC transporter permease protein ArtM [Cedecea neteri]